ncbi:hypothetical protein AND_009127 [Anopheles darlingi]|uniref:Kazal-like domain-containing protein n=1 Tax=Anopheles darlingi TaxID=43151 RepID=W5J8V7_ANODA|nr:hypothetical protein AND_009127 [Anopheles darlingi]
MKSLFVAIVILQVLALLENGSVAASRRSSNGICACPRNYNPVCGSDSQTYANSCLLECKAEELATRSISLRIAHQGSCDEPLVEMPEDR